MTVRPGVVVAWWHGDRLAFGLVVAEEKQRWRLVPPRGKDERVKPSRIAAVVADGEGVSGADPAERERAATLVAEVEERVRVAAAGIEVALLWEILSGEGDATPAGARPTVEIAELALGESSGPALAAVTLALLADATHFVRRGNSWHPREAAAVAALRAEREGVARREAEQREFLAAIVAAVASGTYRATGSDTERRSLEALHQLAVHQEAVPDATRTLAIEVLEASGIRGARPHEGAFRLLRRLGHYASDDENLQVWRFDLRTEFPAVVLEQARSSAAAGFDRAGRRDLTGLAPISVDAPRTREIDDLLSVEPLPGGGYRMGVHIADPGAFVAPDDAVDREALSRGVTHYLPDLRLPMLPPELSERAASLVAEAERPALSFLVDLNEEGEVAGFELTPSVVRCAQRLSYEQADRMIAAGEPVLAWLAEVGRLRQGARVRAGAVTIHAPEVDVHVDADGRVVLERIAAGSPARLAVSEAMVLVGEIAAGTCVRAGLPAVFRRQAAPAEPPELPPSGRWDPVAVRRVRRGLRRAEVGLTPGRHAGLGLDAYAQATSPLRRYQDLVIHRQLLAHVRGEPPCYDTDAMGRIAATTERAEADARRAEAAADDYWLLRYLERFRGQSIAATVVELEPRPIVQLDETLREQPMRALAGVELGQRIRLTVVRVEPRAGLLSLRVVD